MNRKNTISLRALRKSDSENLYKWITDRSTVIFNARYKPISYMEHEEWLANIVKSKDIHIFGIIKTEDEALIGSCQLNNIDSVSGSAELQIRIGSEADRGNGYGSQACSLLLDYGFKDLNLNMIQLYVFNTNERAIKTYEKLGFKKEGLLRQAAFIDGKHVDIIVMSILRKEFDASN